MPYDPALDKPIIAALLGQTWGQVKDSAMQLMLFAKPAKLVFESWDILG